MYLGSFFLDPEDITNLSTGPSGTLVKEQGCFNLVSEYGAQRPCFKGIGASGLEGLEPKYYSILFFSNVCVCIQPVVLVRLLQIL
jgi:hypothetical protein